MKKTAKKTTSKTKVTRATKNLEVKPAKGGNIRGGVKEPWK